MIVILGSIKDPHVEFVANVLQTKHKVKFVVVDYSATTEIALHQDRLGRFEINFDGNNVSEPFLVWDRVKLLPGTELYLQGEDAHVGYAANEWRSFYRLLSRLASLGAVNSLFSYTYLSKPMQHKIAAEAGFLVPSTLVTNVKRVASDFLKENERGTIMKSLSGAKVNTAGEGERIPFNIMTMRVTSADIEEASAEELSFCPHFFQEEIKKAYELRIVYVAGRLFAFRINSQEYKTTEVDWRKGLWALEYIPFQLDLPIIDKINDFMSRAGLFGGSIDLIVDKFGDFWFLECNQDGAWGWLNEICDGAIAEAYADALVERLRTLTSEPKSVLVKENLN